MPRALRQAQGERTKAKGELVFNRKRFDFDQKIWIGKSSDANPRAGGFLRSWKKLVERSGYNSAISRLVVHDIDSERYNVTQIRAGSL
jgi:hypothetical protein